MQDWEYFQCYWGALGYLIFLTLQFRIINDTLLNFQILYSKGSDVFLSKIFSTEERKRRFKDQFFLSAATLIGK